MSLNIFPMSWYIGITKRPHLLKNLVMHNEAIVLHPIFQTILPYLAFNLEHKNLLFRVFWLFWLAYYAILGSRCERLFWTLCPYSTTLSMAMISMGSDPISRIRRAYHVCFLTCKNFVRKCFCTFSNSFQVDLGMLPPHTKASMSPKCRKGISWRPNT